MEALSVILITVFAIISCAGCAGMGSKTVGKQITKDKFKEFFYTYSATVNPPEFQRYRFFVEDGVVSEFELFCEGLVESVQ